MKLQAKQRLTSAVPLTAAFGWEPSGLPAHIGTPSRDKGSAKDMGTYLFSAPELKAVTSALKNGGYTPVSKHEMSSAPGMIAQFVPAAGGHQVFLRYQPGKRAFTMQAYKSE